MWGDHGYSGGRGHRGHRAYSGNPWRGGPRLRQATVRTESVQSCQEMVDQVREMIQMLTTYGEAVAALAENPHNHKLAGKAELYNAGVGQLHNLLKITATETRRAGEMRPIELAATVISEFEGSVQRQFPPDVARTLAPHVENMKRIVQGRRTCTVLAPAMAAEDITEDVVAGGMGHFMAAVHHVQERRDEVAANVRKFDEQHDRRLANGAGKRLMRGEGARVSMPELQRHVRDGPKFMADQVGGARAMAGGARFHLDGTEPDLLGDASGGKKKRGSKRKTKKRSAKASPAAPRRRPKRDDPMDEDTSSSGSSGSDSDGGCGRDTPPQRGRSGKNDKKWRFW